MTCTVSVCLRWSFLKLESTKRLWTRCCTRRCRRPTSPCWRPLVAAITTVAPSARRRRGPEEPSSVSASVEFTSRGTVHTMTGSWDTETEKAELPGRVFGFHKNLEYYYNKCLFDFYTFVPLPLLSLWFDDVIFFSFIVHNSITSRLSVISVYLTWFHRVTGTRDTCEYFQLWIIL